MTTTSSDLKVERIQQAGDDEMICRAARVSTGNDQGHQGKVEGLIKYLARKRHTSPFEHTLITYRIEAPIFVSREAVRHRTFSYNEISARYADMPQVFYVPDRGRPLVNEGTGANPNLVPGTDEQYEVMVEAHQETFEVAVRNYDRQRDIGIASEVARGVIPVSMYSAWYMTGNLHAWYNFLTLRMDADAQWEIRQVANQIYDDIRSLFPIATEAWAGLPEPIRAALEAGE